LDEEGGMTATSHINAARTLISLVLHCSPLDSCCTHALCTHRCSEPAARQMCDDLAGPFSVGTMRYILHAALVCE
jgi:hypothetical protein